MGRKRTGGIDDRGTRRYARITVTLENGKTKRKRVRIDAALPTRNARRVARDISKEAEGYIFEASSESSALGASPTVDDYHDSWAKERARKGRYNERSRYVTHIGPVLGKKRMADVGKNDARALAAALDDKVQAKKLHWTTATKAWAFAKKMFKDAIDSKIAALRVLESNPFDGVQGPDRGEKKGKQWLYPGEALAALLACDDVPVRWKRLYALSVYLYLRPGELAALEWADVNLDRAYVHVHQAFDLQSGELKSTKTGTTRKVPIKPQLRPLLDTMKAEVEGRGRVVQNTHENKLAEHGMPPTEDLAEKLRIHLKRAKVDRANLHDDRPGTKKITFYDLRATGITWEALANTEFLAIMQRAGHRESKTTLGYIREAVGIDAGQPFPPLPPDLVLATDNGHNRAARAAGLTTLAPKAGNSAARVGRRVASPRGFEPLLQP
jgi:integrase